VVDLRSALQPVVDEPPSTPRPVGEIAAAARRRRQRRRSVAGATLAVAVVVVGGVVASRGSSERVTTVDDPAASTTTAEPEPTKTTSTTASTTSTPPPAPTGNTVVTTTPSTTGPTTPAPTARDCSASPASGPAGGDPFGRIEAESYDAQRGVARTATPGGQGCQVGAGNGDHVMFQLDFGEALATRFEAHVASGMAAGADVVLDARLDAADSPPFATIHVTNTGGSTSFTTLSDDTSAAIGGVHAVYVTVTSSQSTDAVSIDWLRFQP
jgi:hypothetical protein